SVVPSPNPGTANNYLYHVAATSSKDVWAVGTDHVDLPEGPALVTLIEHWDGSAWRVVSSPNPYSGSARNALNSVTAVNRNNIWAVGWSCGSYSSCFDGITNPQT